MLILLNYWMRLGSLTSILLLIPTAFLAVGIAPLLSSPVLGGPSVVLDGSLGPSGPLPGPNFIINAALGRQIGPNLFQSFSDFNLTSAQSATFTATGSTGPISNILARVTGGSPSSIDGTITSQIAGANLFLLNPSGVVFGPHAQVNVTGSFAVGTPDYVKLADGGKFSTSLGDDSQLSSASVSAFGFLSATPQPVSFSGAHLSVPSATGLHVIAGDITLDQGSPDGVNQQGTSLFAPSGSLTLFSAASAGEIPFSLNSPGSNYATAPFAALGNITVRNQSRVSIGGAGGGNLVIHGGRIVVNDSEISSFNSGAVAGGKIFVQANEMTISNGGFISTDCRGPGDAGAIAVTVNQGLEISGVGSQISANTDSAGNGGLVTVDAGGTIDLNYGNIFATDASFVASGRGGEVQVFATALSMEGQADISTVTHGAGVAGTVRLTLTGSLVMTDDATIAADTYTGVSGGDIEVSATQVNMTGTSLISADTLFASGHGGNVSVRADSLSIQGSGSETPGTLGITADTRSPGDAGTVTVAASSVSLGGGGVISSSSSASGNGGNVSVRCDQGQISGASSISANSLFTDAGSVAIAASNALTLSNGGSVNTSAGENGGNITLKVGRLLYLLDSDITAFAGYIPANVGGGGVPQPGLVGGNIQIDPQFVILDGSLISANDLSPGGRDGSITNSANYFFTSNSLLHATGTIQSPAPDLDLAQSLAFLPANLTQPGNRLRERCAESVNHEFSTFIVVGRGGVESAPEELQPDFGLDLPTSTSTPHSY